MEAVPRLPMLSFDLKVSPEKTSFGPKLKQYIRSFYNEDPEMYANEIHSLEGLRASAVCAVRDVTGCSTLKRYYCQLHFLQSRFPMNKDGAAAVPFTWRDTYASMVCTLADIRFEMVAILYNIGALHSQLGASDTRTTSDGMKMSCTHFQCAAWAFQHLKDSFPQPAGVDLAPDVMQFMYHLSLAQAQECILEKSMMDNRKATIIAKVAAQIVDYYNLALNTLEQGGSDDCTVSETVGSKIYKTWKRYVKFKTAYHSCVALLYQGQQAEEQQKMGERVAYYQAAAEKLEEAAKLSKGMDNSEVINEALIFTADVVEGKKKAAKNENEFIYHEEVPEKDILPDVKGASLVKGIPFNVNDPDISGPDIFARLVPMKAHEASSLYSEEKAKLLRRVGTEIDEKDEELVSFMTSLQLEHLNIHNESNKLPQELVDRCAAISAKPDAIQNLIDSMNKLSDTYHDVEAMLQEIRELLQEEEIREREYQEIVGKRPPSIVATDLTREAGKYQEAHGKASESNQTLHKAMLLHVSNLRVLAQPLSDLQKSIPEVARPSSPEDEATVEELRRLVAKVEEMRRQRAMLSSQLRESICQDDITRQLVTRANEPLDAIFSQELQKHQRYVTLVEQNLAAQENILHALTDAYAKYGSTRKATNETVRKRDATITALIASYDAYEDLLAKSSKGLEFYRKLEVNVSKLLQRVRSACKVQEEEREQVLAKAMPSAAAAALAPGSTSMPGGAIPSTSKDSSSVEPNTAPKLRDYLQNMKRGAAAVGGYGSSSSSSSGQPDMSSYYASTYAPAPLGTTVSPMMSASTSSSINTPPSATNPPVFYDQVSTSTSQSQWSLPPVRPAPVGSEGPDVSQPEPVHAKTSMSTTSSIADTGKPGSLQQIDMSAAPSNTYPPGYLAGAAFGTPSSPYPAQPQYKPITGSTFQQYSSYPEVYNQNSYLPPSSAPASVYMYTGSYQNQGAVPSPSQASYAATGALSTATSVTGSYHSPQATGIYQGTANNASQSAYQISAVASPGYQTPTSSHVSPSGVGQPPSSSSKPFRSTFDKLFAPQGPGQLPTSQQYQPIVSGAAASSGFAAGTGHSGIWPQQHFQTPHSAYSQYQQYMTQSHVQPPQTPQSQPTQPAHLQQAQQGVMTQTQQNQQTQQSLISQQPQTQPAHLQQPQHGLMSQTPQSQPTQPAHLQQTQPSLMSQQQQPQSGLIQQPQQVFMSHQQQTHPTQLQQSHQTLMSQQYSQQQQQSVSQYSQMQQTETQTQQYPQQYQQVSQLYPQQVPQQYSQHQHVAYSQTQSQNTSYVPRHVQFAQQPSQEAISALPQQDSKTLKASGSQLSSAESSQSQTSVQYGAIPAPGGAGDQPWGQQQPASPYTPASTYSAYPYAAASASSYYTSAGRYPTSQTSSTQTGVEGHTFAAQYNTNTIPTSAYTNNAQTQSRAYYSTPYGYQSPDSPAQQTQPNPLDPQNMTYMQASGNKQTTTTTYMYHTHTDQNSGSHSLYPVQAPDANQVPTPAANHVPTPATSATQGPISTADTPSAKTSNVDLLAGLDFSLNQAPLTPQQLPVSKSEEVVPATSTTCLSPVSSTSTVVSTSTTNVANSPPTVNVATETPADISVKSSSSESVSGKEKKIPVSAPHLEAEEGLKNTENRQSKVSGKDPYSDSEFLNQFVQEVEKYEKFVEGLTSKTLNGPTPLDIKWKELLDLQEKDTHKRSISVARCYPMKNRYPDILPYDNSRVELPSTKDDYINASFVKGINSLAPSFILTQAPLPSTVNDFWTMVMEQQVEVVVCLLSDAELSGQIYWPVEKSQEMVSGKLRLTLQSCNARAHWVERILSVTCGDTRSTRVIVHLQFSGWPGSSFPPSPGPFLALVLEVLSLHKQQRVASHPIVVHCLSGVGRSGLLCVLTDALLEVQAGRGLVDLVPVAASISSQRKNCLRDRQHLQFAYQALLYHAQDLLMKRGILTTRSTFEDKRNRGSKCHTRHPSEDFLLGAPADLSQLQSGLDSMGLGASQTDSNEGCAEPTEKLLAPPTKAPINEPDPLSQLDPLWTMKQI